MITSTKSKVEKYIAAKGAGMDWLSSVKLPLKGPGCKCRRFHPHSLVAVVVGLVGAFDGQAQVVGLLRGEGGELDGQGVEVRSGNLLVKLLGEHVHGHGVLARVAPQFNLCEHLVGEGGGHDEAGVAHGTPKVDQAALSEEDEVLAVGECVPVNLGLDVGLLLAVLLQPLDLDLAVEVADVADDGVILHLHEVFAGDDVLAPGGGHEDVAPGDGVVHGGHLESLAGGLEGVDGVDLCHDDTATETLQGGSTALTNISVSGNTGDL